MQNLHYTYDPVGNITHIQDDAQQTIFFANSRVEPSNDYIYDALYRLIEATGRENAAAARAAAQPGSPWPTGGFPSADALRNYTQRYRYDAVGNLVADAAPRRSPATAGRGTTPPKSDSNRLRSDLVRQQHARGRHLSPRRSRQHAQPQSDHATAAARPEDEWGLDIRWDWRDMILGFDLGGGGLARYHYGIDKQRTRKYIMRNTAAAPACEDRIYLGGYELYRRRNPGRTVVEEIESLHLFEGEQRVLLVDDVIIAGGTSRYPRHDRLSVKEQTLFRYQYGNHLGSACLGAR